MAPYLTIVIPVEIYNFIETMDNVEAANAAGDNYNVRETQFADGICTMISAICGGVVPNTVWLGHAGLKNPMPESAILFGVGNRPWCSRIVRTVYFLKLYGSAGSLCGNILVVCDCHGGAGV